jgi:hypothetical protein
MARDPEIALCMECPFRPVDAETGKRVEDGLRVSDRVTEVGKAVVIYSYDDPRYNSQVGIINSSDAYDVARKAQRCTSFVAGLAAGLYGGFNSRIEDAARQNTRKCAVSADLFINGNLPDGLLYQTPETTGS